MNYLLGIDAGTTSVKAGLFAVDGHCLAVTRQEYQLDTPSAERAQLEPEIYWQACIKTVQQVVQQAGVPAGQITAVAVSSQGETTITLDRHGKAIYPALVWLDNRARTQAKHLAKVLGAQVYARTGIPEVIPTWSACKILWIKENEPEVFARADKFMLVQDYLIYRLCGQTVTDGSISCTTMNYDIVSHTWWDEALAAIGITSSRLPEIINPGTRVGQVSEAVAKLLDISSNTQVVNGGMDQAVGAIGAANFKPGMVSEATGAALAIQATIADPSMDRTHRMPVYCHSVPGMYLAVPVCPTAGMALKWFRDTFSQSEIQLAETQGQDAYDLMTKLAEAVPVGADGLIMLPHLMGAFSPNPNPAARASFTGITLRHTRGHFIRAVLEGVAFMLKQNLETITQAGIPMSEIISMGGGSRSRLWNQIKADVCNLPIVTLVNEETGLLGDAILAGVASGNFDSIEQACGGMVARGEVFLPGPNAEAYRKPYGMYLDLDKTLSDYYKRSYSSVE